MIPQWLWYQYFQPRVDFRQTRISLEAALLIDASSDGWGEHRLQSMADLDGIDKRDRYFTRAAYRDSLLYLDWRGRMKRFIAKDLPSY